MSSDSQYHTAYSVADDAQTSSSSSTTTTDPLPYWLATQEPPKIASGYTVTTTRPIKETAQSSIIDGPHSLLHHCHEVLLLQALPYHHLPLPNFGPGLGHPTIRTICQPGHLTQMLYKL